MKKFQIVFILNVLFVAMIINCNAHSLYSWSDYYPASNANSVYSFGIKNVYHINGNNVKYKFATTSARNNFESAAENSFDEVWQGLVTGTEVNLNEDANVLILYDSAELPGGAAAFTIMPNVTGNYARHYSSSLVPGTTITIAHSVSDYSNSDKEIVMAHEFGHLWGIDDLYTYNTTLDSMYSRTYSYTTATRHDRNAMRICLNNFWFNPGNSLVWMYQSSPGVFTLRGDASGDSLISVEDARLILRFSINEEVPSDLQNIVSDVDGDNAVTVSDARLVLRYAIGSEIKFPTDYDE